MNRESITQIREKLDNREISSLELFEYFKERIEKYDKELNSFITTDFEKAEAAAKAADELIAKGEQKSLTGIPIAHKDLLCTEGLLTTAASQMLSNFIPPYNATVVDKMAQLGAVSLGKLNLDEFAMGSTGETSYYGVSRNPWNKGHVAGGSSSGSATAVSAGLVLGATASDTGGSIRQPASFCGITGLKPTYGRISRHGAIAFASSLDQVGVMARSAEDCALLYQAIAGFDEKDPTSMEQPVISPKLDQYRLDGVKIGVPKEFFDDSIDTEVANRVEEALKLYQSMGAELVEVSFKYHNLITPIYYVIATAEASSNLARYDGVRYGYRCKDPKDLEDLYMRTRGEAFGAEVKSRILLGTYALTEEHYEDYYRQAQRIRRLVSQEYREILSSVDFIAGPSVPTTAFKVGQDMTGIENSLFDANLIGANLAGLPALSHPAGFVNDLPVGLQLIGRPFDEATILAAAHRYQQESDWHQQLPPIV